ncbi:MAG: hypothetical protein IKW80_08725, partial [Thermoguttaceae bacterium]|nr:hypothetical protein [Thermoguttaceae bacterium]
PLLIKLEKTSLKGSQLAGDLKFFQVGGETPFTLTPKGLHFYNRRFLTSGEGDDNKTKNRQILFSFPPGACGAGRERKGLTRLGGAR